MIDTIGPKDLVKLTKGKVDSRGATVIFNILDEIKHKLVSVKDFDKAAKIVAGRNKNDAPVNNNVVIDTDGVNPDMIKELNNTLEIIFANTKRSNREAMNAAAEEVVALIKKFS